MTWAEFRQWAAFYERHPFDDFHLHTLPAAIQISANTGEPLQKIINLLTGQADKPAPKKQAKPETPHEIDLSVFAAFGTIPPRNMIRRTE